MAKYAVIVALAVLRCLCIAVLFLVAACVVGCVWPVLAVRNWIKSK